MPLPTGPAPLHVRLPPEVLTDICALIEKGVATLESAFKLHFRTTRTSIYRSLEVGRKATEKIEAGEILTEADLAAVEFATKLEKALATRQHWLTEGALGLEPLPEGGYGRDPRRESTNAMRILAISTPELRSPYIDPEERELQAAPTPEPLDDASLLAGLERLKASRPELLDAAGLVEKP